MKSKEEHERIGTLHELVGDYTLTDLATERGDGLTSFNDFDWCGDMLEKTYTMGTYEGSLTKEEKKKAKNLYRVYKDKCKGYNLGDNK